MVVVMMMIIDNDDSGSSGDGDGRGDENENYIPAYNKFYILVFWSSRRQLYVVKTPLVLKCDHTLINLSQYIESEIKLE